MHQTIDPSVPGHQVIRPGAGRVEIQQIHLSALRLTSRGGHVVGYPRRLRLVCVGDSDTGTGSGQPPRHSGAGPTSGACDRHDRSGERAHDVSPVMPRVASTVSPSLRRNAS